MTDKISYETHIRPFSNSFERITFTDEEIKKATKWAIGMENAKLQEQSWQRDSGSIIKRLVTGMLGEMALEKYLDLEFIDWTIGDTLDYDKPDLLKLGVDIGVKTVEFSEGQNGVDKFPVILKDSTYPEIFTFYKPTQKSVYICGIATLETLGKYRTDSLLISPTLRQKGTKTCFYGFEHLEPPTKIKEYINPRKS